MVVSAAQLVGVEQVLTPFQNGFVQKLNVIPGKRIYVYVRENWGLTGCASDWCLPSSPGSNLASPSLPTVGLSVSKRVAFWNATLPLGLCKE